MPLFLDLHKIRSTAKENLKFFPEEKLWKENNGCRCVSSWIDLQKNQVVSLFDAPTKNVLKKQFKSKAEVGTHEIIPVNSKVAEVFLERLQPENEIHNLEVTRFKLIKKEAELRIFLVLFSSDPFLLLHHLGEKKFSTFYPNFLRITGNTVSKLQGRVIFQKKGLGIFSFFSVYNALKSAEKIKKKCHPFKNVAPIKLVLVSGENSAGEKSDFFSRFNFYEKHKGKIMVASRIHEICGSSPGKLPKSDFTCLVSSEENLLKLLMQVLNQNWQNPNFDCMEFCRKISMSKSGLYRKCTAITARSPNRLIKEYRLLQALNLLKMGQSITRTGYDTGFNSPSYFTRCFQEQFKIQPRVYRRLCQNSLR